MMRIHRYLTLAFVLLAAAGAARAQQPSSNPPEVGLEEHLGQMIPLTIEMYNDSGKMVTLNQIINKPTIVTFVYFRCPGICTPLLNELSRMVEKMDLELGSDYQILTLSFDHSETPDLAADKRDNYLSSIKKPVNPGGWRFYTADSLNIHRFTSAAGFFFKRDGKDWVHPATLVFLSPEGKVTRYIYGIQYLPFDVKMAVIEASNGRVGPTIAKVLNFCYSYDPESHRYALNVTRIGLALTLVCMGVFAIVFIFRPKKRASER